jgi:hypothetical protein
LGLEAESDVHVRLVLRETGRKAQSAMTCKGVQCDYEEKACEVLYDHENSRAQRDNLYEDLKLILSYEVLMAFTMMNDVLCDIKTQFVPQRRHYFPATEPR